MEVSTPVAPVAEVVAPVIEEAASVSAHEAQFGPQASREPAADDDEAPRHRARGQQAKAGDVEEIATYTKRLRDAEAELGIPSIERKDGESQRVFELRRRAEIAEAMREVKRQPEPQRQPQPVAQPDAFTKKKPTWDDFATEADPGTAYYEALSDWKDEKRQHERQAREATAHSEAAQRAQAQQHTEMLQAHAQRNATFAATHPDFTTALEANPLATADFPHVLTHTIISDDKSAELMYHLAKHPDDLSDMILLAGSQPPTAQTVALLRRRLHSLPTRTQAETTGAAVSASLTRIVPRPPTPVKTSTVKTADELPADEHDLATHEKTWGAKSRR